MDLTVSWYNDRESEGELLGREFYLRNWGNNAGGLRVLWKIFWQEGSGTDRSISGKRSDKIRSATTCKLGTCRCILRRDV